MSIYEQESQLASRADEAKLAAIQQQAADVRVQLNEAQRRVKELQVLEKTRTSLRIRREDLNRKETELKDMLTLRRPLMEDLLVGAPLRPATCEQDITDKLRVAKQQTALQSHQVEEFSKRLSEVEGRMDTRSKDIARMEAALAELQAKLAGHDNVPAEIDAAEEKVAKKRESVLAAAPPPRTRPLIVTLFYLLSHIHPSPSILSLLDHPFIIPFFLTRELQRTEVSVVFYTKYIGMAEETCRCPLCERNFSRDQLGTFLVKARPTVWLAGQGAHRADFDCHPWMSPLAPMGRLVCGMQAKERIEQAPQFRVRNQDLVTKAEQKRDALRALRGPWEDARKLTADLPAAKTELGTLAEQRTKLQAEGTECGLVLS
ncbi:hypothetical protein PAPYR_560 [Paratrimastix pyriformis]|uniref:Uncharacterized protein n=1 Tax=Paratrimastix pyriformis TaxID=342808 RepID=A0ABQ8UTX9_9EUKA|nr:hypothetical protein PAPYR_560 [Paratrimastix pyriformis]